MATAPSRWATSIVTVAGRDLTTGKSDARYYRALWVKSLKSQNLFETLAANVPSAGASMGAQMMTVAQCTLVGAAGYYVLNSEPSLRPPNPVHGQGGTAMRDVLFNWD